MSISVNAGTSGSSHVHNPATADTLGTVKVGTRLSIDGNGVLSANVVFELGVNGNITPIN